ncbi:MAG: 3-methyl-2-oxobutanoate dehydrogenase subunit VorB [Planctomycetota bacterium]
MSEKSSQNQANQRLISGNEAAGEAAIRAGCRFYAGYPITPQNELIAYMADQLPLRGGTFVQAESEIAAINMLFGASAGGARCMTSSSSPGISLKQEGISYLAGAQLPAVIVNVQRGGPGLGGIGPSQGDYFQTTKGGGHGDYRCITLAPASVQETAELAFEAFELADKYRNPVVILSDAMIGQMMENADLDVLPEPSSPPKPWALTGADGRDKNVIRSLYFQDNQLTSHNERLQDKYSRITDAEVRCETLECEDAEVVVVAYGSSARIARELIVNPPDVLEPRVGLFRPVTLWPFPTERLASTISSADAVLTLEMSAGQLVEDVRLSANTPDKVHLMACPGEGVPTVEEISENINSILDS